MSDTRQDVRTLAIEHVTLVCRRSFQEVREALEGIVPKLDLELPELLRHADAAEIADQRAHGAKLWLFLTRDHGALIAAEGRAEKALQFEIGNPLTAETMTRRQLGAALYAPLRVVLYEDPRERAVFEYDRPSSFFGQFGDEQVAAVGRELDAELEAALTAAAG
jgi:uncharacterized protein (DUF302 family)